LGEFRRFDAREADTDVLVSAFISPAGASRQLLLDALDGKFALLLSTPLLVEYA
jgi:predicted nucleic acid-binding protein